MNLIQHRAIQRFNSELTRDKSSETNRNKSTDKLSDASDALLVATEQFACEAELAIRKVPLTSRLLRKETNSKWNYNNDLRQLKVNLLSQIARYRHLNDIQVKSAQLVHQAMQYAQSQQQAGSGQQRSVKAAISPWSSIVSFGVPKTPLNVIGTYNQGQGNIQITCAADESPMNGFMGSDGFVHGVTPGNIGVSFNVNI